MLLKADFHVHTREDPHDFIRYTAVELLEEAARQGFDVLALTCHNKRIHTEELRRRAEGLGIHRSPGGRTAWLVEVVLPVHLVSARVSRQLGGSTRSSTSSIVTAPTSRLDESQTGRATTSYAARRAATSRSVISGAIGSHSSSRHRPNGLLGDSRSSR